MIKWHIFLVAISCMLHANCFSQINKDTSINVYFETNSYSLDSIQYRRLNNFTSVYFIKSIIGYADTTGSKGYNVSLSKKRALVVYAAMKNDLFNKNNLLFKGESTEDPELGKNRRVQIIAHQKTDIEPHSDAVSGTPKIIRTFNLEYVYFIPDQAIVTQESLPYLQQLSEIIKTYKTEKVEIIGHINYQSRFDSSHVTDIYRLSERRARTIFDFLVESGIPATRITYKGVGNSQPVYRSPINEEEKRKNMRVQIVIKE